ncbi:MAG TPA: deaminase [Myxococcota bacterium]|nr:deaminase [Myxococcota bacterium]
MKIGVAGPNASGKGEVVRLLERRSFYRASLSDAIRADLARDGLEPTREHMIERGKRLRERFGAAVLAERVARSLPSDRNHVIDSIRHPAEAEALRAGGDFALFWVDAAPELRFERSRARGRAGDGDDFPRFQELERRELASADAGGQQLLAVRELADVVLTNDGSLAELEAQVEEALRDRLFFRERPSWDEYFMSIARVVASRSNCIKRKVGSVIALDRRIISTGYNGTPRGIRNCNEGGCPRCAGAAEAGTRLDECLCSHAEENAITQSAYHGVSVRGGTVYTTFCPCLICTKMIINAGLSEVVYDAHFPLGEVSVSLFREAGIKVRQLGG